MTPINTNKALSELNSFASIRVIRGQTWLAGILILSLCPNAFAQTDFSTFWKKFRSAVIAGNKATVAEMTKFPLSMPAFQKAVKNKEAFLRRYNEIFKGEANAAQCFGSAKPEKQSARRYEIFCPFKDTPDDKENAPIRFIFELTKSGWKFAGSTMLTSDRHKFCEFTRNDPTTRLYRYALTLWLLTAPFALAKENASGR